MSSQAPLPPPTSTARGIRRRSSGDHLLTNAQESPSRTSASITRPMSQVCKLQQVQSPEDHTPIEPKHNPDPIELPASITAEIAGEITHRAGYLWRYEHRSGLAVFVPGSTRVWRKRWVVLRGHRLVVYKNEKEYSPQRIIHLTNTLEVRKTQHVKGFDKGLPGSPSAPATPSEVLHEGGSPVLRINHTPEDNEAHASLPTSPSSYPEPTSDDTASNCFQILATDKTYLFGALTQDEMCAWVRDLRALMRDTLNSSSNSGALADLPEPAATYRSTTSPARSNTLPQLPLSTSHYANLRQNSLNVEISPTIQETSNIY